MCICPIGETLSNDSYTCEDLDECNPPGLCSQTCKNIKGSYSCSCVAGYQLEPDKHRCKAYSELLKFIYVLTHLVLELLFNL